MRHADRSRRALAVTLAPLLALACGASAPETEASSSTSALSSSAEYQNPIIPMFRLPAHDVSKPTFAASEGCPDPTGLKTTKGKFYIYCSSYTVATERYSGFPTFESDSLGGNHWTWVGSIIPDSGPARRSWPAWIHGTGRAPYGNFWAPDVHELPGGKFVATYAAPCGAQQCIGMAWSSGPNGPWRHKNDAPFLGPASSDVYDPNVLVARNGHTFLYYAVGGVGLFVEQVQAESSGELRSLGGASRIVDWREAEGPEGPYVIEHDGVYYHFYSNGGPEGGILYDYQVHVRRSTSPTSGFSGEDRLVLHKSTDAKGGAVSGTAFVATGGNSVIQDAAGGVDYIVYHAIKVPDGAACPGTNPANGSVVSRTSNNPYCRVQGERQAMIDPIEWQSDGAGGQWPTVRGGTPSTGVQAIP
jgi:beta-xylosidase